MPEKPLEILAVRQDVVGKRGWEIPVFPVTAGADANGAIKAHRQVCFGANAGSGFGWIDTPIYDAAKLEPGHELHGPAVIEAVDTTIVLQAGDRCQLNKYQVFEIHIDEGADEVRH
jgi:N-methylhydantoinase A